MEIRVDRSSFLGELLPMQGIVERKSTIPVLSHILLRGEADHLHLAATDLDVSLTSSCAADVVAPGGIAVQAKKFVEIVRSVVGDEVHLQLEDGKFLKIKAARSEFKIHGLPAEDFPTLPEVPEDGRLEIPFQLLKRMIAKTLFAVSTEESRFQLNGALFKLKEEGLEIVATDGHRLALVENALEGSGAEQQGVLVPRKALQELLRFEGEGTVVFSRGEHHLTFQVGERNLICRILEGTFPDYERVIAKDNDKHVTVGRKALSDSVQRVALLTGDRARAVRLRFAANELVVSATNPDLGEATEELECEYAGDEIAIGLNPDYLGQFLAAVETESVRLDLKDENTQCVGVPVEGADQRYLCVIMPMRV